MIGAPLRTFNFGTELEYMCHAVKIVNYFPKKFKTFNLLFTSALHVDLVGGGIRFSFRRGQFFAIVHFSVQEPGLAICTGDLYLSSHSFLDPSFKFS